MATTTADNIQIIGGVDTHQDLHTAAVVSHDGSVPNREPATGRCFAGSAPWRAASCRSEESTGTYGAGMVG